MIITRDGEARVFAFKDAIGNGKRPAVGLLGWSHSDVKNVSVLYYTETEGSGQSDV